MAAYNNTYSWTRTNSNWFKVLSYLYYNGGATKREIVSAIWSNVYINPDAFRGWNSHLFACLNADDIIKYVPSKHKWYVGTNGAKIMFNTLTK